MKTAGLVVGGIVTGIGFLVGVTLILLAIAAYPAMLIMGALHNGSDVGWIPAWGFWTTLLVLWLVGIFGHAWNGTHNSSTD